MPSEVEHLPDFYHGMHVISKEFFDAFPEETFILDRSFISELVYSKAFGRKTYIKSEDIFEMLKDNNFILLNMNTIYSNYLKRVPKDKKVYTENEFNRQKDLFYWFFENYKTAYSTKKWQSRFIELDTNSTPIADCIENIIQIIEKNKILKNKLI